MDNDFNSYNYNQVHKTKKKGKGGLVIALFVIGMLLSGGLFGSLTLLITSGSTAISVDDFATPEPTSTPDAGQADTFEPQEMPDINVGEAADNTELSTEEIATLVTPQTVGILAYSGELIAKGGTGIIMSADGYVITNAHVVEDISYAEILLWDDRVLEVEIVGADVDSDLAVLKIIDPPADLAPVTFGDSSQLRIGEKVVAIGNPGGLAGTVTQGVVSGTERTMGDIIGDTENPALPMIQTDAAINPGNSGGPLVNGDGQVIGVTTSKITRIDYEGIGFAISINEALPILERIITEGSIPGKPELGITVFPLNTLEEIPESYGLEAGLVVLEMKPNSDLLNYGISPGDVIVQADGVDLFENNELTDLIASKNIGDTIDLVVWKSNTGQQVQFPAVLRDSKG